jgi:hypothetical protein
MLNKEILTIIKEIGDWGLGIGDLGDLLDIYLYLSFYNFIKMTLIIYIFKCCSLGFSCP